VDLPLHEARGMYMGDISSFRMSLLVDSVVTFAIGQFSELRIND
jgi:hypothetical protein